MMTNRGHYQQSSWGAQHGWQQQQPLALMAPPQSCAELSTSRGLFRGRPPSSSGNFRQITCFNCGKPGHRAAECWNPRQQGSPFRGRGISRSGRFQGGARQMQADEKHLRIEEIPQSSAQEGAAISGWPGGTVNVMVSSGGVRKPQGQAMGSTVTAASPTALTDTSVRHPLLRSSPLPDPLPPLSREVTWFKAENESQLKQL